MSAISEDTHTQIPDLFSLSVSSSEVASRGASKVTFSTLNEDVKRIILSFAFKSDNEIVDLLYMCYKIRHKRLLHSFADVLNTQRVFAGSNSGDYECNQKATLLMQICSEESVHMGTLEFILSLRVDVNMTNHDIFKLTPLMIAASTNCSGGEVCKALIAVGAEMDIQASDGITALIKCAQEGHLDNAKVLIDAGCNLDLVDKKEGRTALHWAAYIGRPEVARILVNNGAQLQIRDNEGLTPLEQACEEKICFTRSVGQMRKAAALNQAREEIQQLLRDAGAA